MPESEQSRESLELLHAIPIQRLKEGEQMLRRGNTAGSIDVLSRGIGAASEAAKRLDPKWPEAIDVSFAEVGLLYSRAEAYRLIHFDALTRKLDETTSARFAQQCRNDHANALHFVDHFARAQYNNVDPTTLTALTRGTNYLIWRSSGILELTCALMAPSHTGQTSHAFMNARRYLYNACNELELGFWSEALLVNSPQARHRQLDPQLQELIGIAETAQHQQTPQPTVQQKRFLQLFLSDSLRLETPALSHPAFKTHGPFMTDIYDFDA